MLDGSIETSDDSPALDNLVAAASGSTIAASAAVASGAEDTAAASPVSGSTTTSFSAASSVAASAPPTVAAGFGVFPLLLLPSPSPPDDVHSVRRSGRGASDTAPCGGSGSRSARIAGSRGAPRDNSRQAINLGLIRFQEPLGLSMAK